MPKIYLEAEDAGKDEFNRNIIATKGEFATEALAILSKVALVQNYIHICNHDIPGKMCIRKKV